MIKFEEATERSIHFLFSSVQKNFFFFQFLLSSLCPEHTQQSIVLQMAV